MVNNSTNINKIRESLNSDGQQFYKYQQNKRKFKQWWSTIIIPPISLSTKWSTTSCLKHLKTKRPWHMTLEIQVLSWDRHKNMAGVKLVVTFWFYDLCKYLLYNVHVVIYLLFYHFYRYLVFYSPFDIVYKIAKFLPCKLVICGLKEVQRSHKVYHAVIHTMKIYPNSYLVIIIIGTVKGKLPCHYNIIVLMYI